MSCSDGHFHLNAFDSLHFRKSSQKAKIHGNSSMFQGGERLMHERFSPSHLCSLLREADIGADDCSTK